MHESDWYRTCRRLAFFVSNGLVVSHAAIGATTMLASAQDFAGTKKLHGTVSYFMSHHLSASSNGSPQLSTAIAAIDGGLRYRGYAIEELVQHSNFAEVAFLVIQGELPTHEQLADLQAILTEAAVLESDLVAWIERIPLNASAIDVMRTAISLIALADCHDDESGSAAAWDTIQRLLAQLPVLVAARYRLARGLKVLESRDDLSYAGNLLWLLTGVEPTSIDLCMSCGSGLWQSDRKYDSGFLRSVSVGPDGYLVSQALTSTPVSMLIRNCGCSRAGATTWLLSSTGRLICQPRVFQSC